MGKFTELTICIPALQEDSFGRWSAEDGQLPYVLYSPAVQDFQNRLSAFCQSHLGYSLKSYARILQRNHIDANIDSLQKLSIDQLPARPVIAILVAAMRAERFCDGAYLGFCESGLLLRCLNRLQEIDRKPHRLF